MPRKIKKKTQQRAKFEISSATRVALAADFIGRTASATQVMLFAVMGETHAFLGVYGIDKETAVLAVAAGGDACKSQGIERVTFVECPASMQRVNPTDDQPGIDLEIEHPDLRKNINHALRDLGSNIGPACLMYIIIRGKKVSYGSMTMYEEWEERGDKLVNSFVDFLGLRGEVDSGKLPG